MGLSSTISAGPRQLSHSQVRVPRDLWPHFTVSDTRLHQTGGPGPRIYEEGGPVIPPGTRLSLYWLKSQSYVTTDSSVDQSVLEYWTTYIISRRTYRKHIRCPAMDICEPHKNTASSVVFAAHCMATEFIRSLPAYSLPREYVYRVFAQQRFYMSQCKWYNSQYGASLLVHNFGRNSGSARNVARSFSMMQQITYIYIYISCIYKAKKKRDVISQLWRCYQIKVAILRMGT
jgi:hypothetical protein